MIDLDSIFLAVREMPVDHRALFLDHACRDNSELRVRVEKMLSSNKMANEFFDDTKAEGAFNEEALTLADEKLLAEGPGSVIGRYKLLQKIGEGGMGIVYMAQQSKPIERKVALKIIKLGMDTRSVIARFEAEQQALAMMDHPNIAGVLDAGATEAGRPFFVMEMVRGIPITEFCNENKLNLRERLELFMDVCHAVQHAHQKGIIHRDIKPSNIMVTLHGGQALPKVIDFGIAKATQGKLTEKILFTQYSQLIGSPAYMSPEQASLSALDIDTRSDIYALGVLLYELLTGRTPLDARKLSSEGFDEIRRRIKEQEAMKPSTCLSTMKGADRHTLAQLRGSDVQSIQADLSGDLDWIVMKAIEKNRAQRYESADAFRADILHYLNHEPVIARAPNFFYLSQKFYRRHKLSISIVASVALLVIAGTAIGYVMLKGERDRALKAEKDANQNLALARSEQLISKATLNFLNKEILGGASSRTGLSGDITLRELLNQASDKVENASLPNPMVESAIRITIGETLATLGEYERSSTQIIKGLELKREELGESTAQTSVDFIKAAYAASLSGNLKQEWLYATKAREILTEAIDEGGDPNDPLFLEADSLMLSSSYTTAEMKAQGIHRLKEYLKLAEAGGETSVELTMRILQCLAIVHSDLNLIDQAKPYYERLIQLGQKHPELILPLYYQSIAGYHHDWDRIEEGQTALVKCVEETKKQFNETERGYIALSQGAQGELFIRQGKILEAKEFYETFYLMYHDDRHYNASRGKVVLNYILTQHLLGQEDEALRILENEKQVARMVPNASSHLLNQLLQSFSMFYAMRGNTEDIENALEILPDSQWFLNDPGLRFHHALLLLQLGKGNDYAMIFQDVIDRFKDCDDSFALSAILPTVLAKGVEMNPSQKESIRQWMACADTKKRLRSQQGSTWLEFCLGLAYFRFGELKDAQKHLAIATRGHFSTEALACLVLAKIDQKSPAAIRSKGHLEKARLMRKEWPFFDFKHYNIFVNERMLFDLLENEFFKSEA